MVDSRQDISSFDFRDAFHFGSLEQNGTFIESTVENKSRRQIRTDCQTKLLSDRYLKEDGTGRRIDIFSIHRLDKIRKRSLRTLAKLSEMKSSVQCQMSACSRLTGDACVFFNAPLLSRDPDADSGLFQYWSTFIGVTALLLSASLIDHQTSGRENRATICTYRSRWSTTTTILNRRWKPDLTWWRSNSFAGTLRYNSFRCHTMKTSRTNCSMRRFE